MIVMIFFQIVSAVVDTVKGKLAAASDTLVAQGASPLDTVKTQAASADSTGSQFLAPTLLISPSIPARQLKKGDPGIRNRPSEPI